MRNYNKKFALYFAFFRYLLAPRLRFIINTVIFFKALKL